MARPTPVIRVGGAIKQKIAQRTLAFKIDVGKLLTVLIAHHEAGFLFFDRPRRREAAGVGHALPHQVNQIIATTTKIRM